MNENIKEYKSPIVDPFIISQTLEKFKIEISEVPSNQKIDKILNSPKLLDSIKAAVYIVSLKEINLHLGNGKVRNLLSLNRVHQ